MQKAKRYTAEEVFHDLVQEEKEKITRNNTILTSIRCYVMVQSFLDWLGPPPGRHTSISTTVIGGEKNIDLLCLVHLYSSYFDIYEILREKLNPPT